MTETPHWTARHITALADLATTDERMTYLRRFLKPDLVIIATRLGLDLTARDPKPDIRRRIAEADLGPTVTEVTVDNLDWHVSDHGPIEISTPDGWRAYVHTQPLVYSRAVVTVMTDTGAWAYRWNRQQALATRPLASSPVDPRRSAPGAGQSRVIPGCWLRRHRGWQWFTPHGTWETITGARSGGSGGWIIATTSAADWVEPDDFAIVRPLVDPVEIVLRSVIVGTGCQCRLWEDSPFVPGQDTTYARYANSACPVHPAEPLPAGRAVAVPATTLAGDGDPAKQDHTGRVIRTWTDPRGYRWYDIAMTTTGEVVTQPAEHVTSAVDPGWGPPHTDGTTHPAIVEVETLQDDDRWAHKHAGLTNAVSCQPEDLVTLAERLAEEYAERTRGPVRVSVIPAKEHYRYLHPDHAGYASAQPAPAQRGARRADTGRH